MKLLFLRGSVPNDRDPREIMWRSLDESNDVWEYLADALGDERAEIIYVGGDRCEKYSEKTTVCWIRNLACYRPDFNPDCIFARGGFDFWKKLLKKYNKTYKVYYGGGQRYVPEDGIKYNLVLADSDRQYHRLRKKGFSALLWRKPTIPMFQAWPETQKEFDVCYVGDGRFPFRAKIKGLHWLYKTAPKDLSILHLGREESGLHTPDNITRRRVVRNQMPKEYSRCRVGIVPYTDYDSAPRVIPEMLACGLHVVAFNTVHQCYPEVHVTLPETAWVDVRGLSALPQPEPIIYGVQECAEMLRNEICQ